MKTMIAKLVRIVNDHDLEHRRGWRPSERNLRDVGDDLLAEVRELLDAIDRYRELQARQQPTHLGQARAEVEEEIADVSAMLHQVMHRLKISPAAIDEEGARKLRLRFAGLNSLTATETHS